MFFSNFVSKKSTSHRPSGISSKSKQLLQVILYLSTFSKKIGLDTLCFLIFRYQDNKKFPTSGNTKKNIFFILSLLGVILQRLCQTSTPCRVPSKELISWDFRPWKSAGGRTPQTCPAPAPTCAGIKYPVQACLTSTSNRQSSVTF